MAKSNQITKTPITRKEYSYQLGGVRLSFTLRQDNTQEMLHFKALLESAVADVNTDIKAFRSKSKR